MHFRAALGPASHVLRFPPTLCRLQQGSTDCRVRIWNLTSPANVPTRARRTTTAAAADTRIALTGHSSPIQSCAYTVDGQRIYSMDVHQVLGWVAASGECCWCINVSEAAVLSGVGSSGAAAPTLWSAMKVWQPTATAHGYICRVRHAEHERRVDVRRGRGDNRWSSIRVESALCSDCDGCWLAARRPYMQQGPCVTASRPPGQQHQC